MNECTKAIDESILELAKTPVCPPLKLNQGTTRVSWEHSKYLVTQNNQDLNHNGPSNVTPTRLGLGDRFKIYNAGT
jgi:hypothetical protein